MRTISDETANAILGISGYGPGTETQGYTFMGVNHVDDRDYESVHLVAFRAPDGCLYGFDAVRRFGRGEGQELQLADEHTAEIRLMPLSSYTKSVQKFRIDYSRLALRGRPPA